MKQLPECGLVIEAVPEDLRLKRRLLADLSERQPASTVLATNTSSLDIDALARDAIDPERVLGLHFFNRPPPVTRRGRARRASPLPATSSTSWPDGRVGKTPVRCASTPGFIVNRVARPFYGEAQRLAEAGVADAAIDWALRERGGFPMGPLRAPTSSARTSTSPSARRSGSRPATTSATRRRTSSAVSSTRAGSVASRAPASTRMPQTARSRGRARPRARRASRRRTGRDRPARPHARDARQRGRSTSCTAARRRRRTSTRRCASGALPARAHRVGSRDRLRRGRGADRRARRGLPEWALPPARP